MRIPKYFLLILAAVLFLFGANFVVNQRLQQAERRIQEELITRLSGFLNAVDQQLFINATNQKRNSSLFERFRHQLSEYESHFPDALYFSIELKNEVPVIAISTNSRRNMMIGNQYPLDKSVIDSVFYNAQPVVLRDKSTEFGLAYKVLVPMLGNELRQIKMVAVMELDAASNLRYMEMLKWETWRFMFIILFILLAAAATVLWRERRSEKVRGKLKHVETIAVFLLGTLLVTSVTTVYRNHLKQEQQDVFSNYADNYATNLRNLFWNIRNNMEGFAVFTKSSLEVDSSEFVNYANQIFKSNAVESMYFFDVDNPDPGSLVVPIPEGDSYSLRFKATRQDGKLLPDQPDDNLVSELARIIRESEKDQLVYGSNLVSIPTDKGNKDVFVICISVPHATNSKVVKTAILAVIDPSYLVSFAFRRNEWLKKTIAIGLTQSLSTESNNWIASYPPDHLDKHRQAGIENHLREYRFHQAYPVFIWGRMFGLMTHSLPDFEQDIKSYSVDFIRITGFVLVFIITFLVFLLRQRWSILEATVDQRTKVLDRRVKDLTCIKNVSALLQTETEKEKVFHGVINQLESTLNLSIPLAVEIVFDDKTYTIHNQLLDCPARFEVSLFANAVTTGALILKSCSEIILSKEDQALLQQIATLLSDFASHEIISKALTTSEAKFRSLVENAFDAIYTLDGKKFTYVNKAFCEMVEYSPEELTDPQFDLGILLTDKSREIVRQRFEARQQGLNLPHRYEFQQLSKTGRIIEVEASTVSVNIEGKSLIIGMLHDITDRKTNEMNLILSEERLQQQNEELQVLNEELIESNNRVRTMNAELFAAKEKAEASDKLKTAFLNNISHELRTPLNGIVGATYLFTDSDYTAEEKREMAEVVKQSTDRLMRTITQYVDISMLNSGSMPVSMEWINLRKMLQPFISDFTNRCIEKKIRFDFELPDPAYHSIYTDKSLFEKILDHLLDNAVKFTAGGSVQCRLRVEGNEWLLIIKDTGIGIDPVFQSKIYDLFMQEDNSNVRRYDGSGLGMPIVKKACDLLGADLSFESTKGVGTTFMVRFKSENSVMEKKLTQNTQEMTSTANNPLILIAEDEDSNFIVLNMLLTKRLSAKVIRASNGEEAVRLCAEQPDIQLVLMDIKMPVMDGYEATQLIKQNRPDLPVIAITAYGLTGDEHKAISAGCDDYLPKPIQIQLLLDKAVRWIK